MVYGSTTGHHHYNESDYISVMELLFKRCSSSRVHTIAILPLEAKKIGVIKSILQKVRQLTDGIYRWARYRKRLRTSLGFKLNRTIHVRTSWTNEVPQYDGHPLTQENRITHCRHLEGNTSSTSGVSFGTVFKNCSSAGRRFSKFWPTLHIKYHLDNPTSTSTSRDCPICIQCQYVTLCRMIAIWTICYQDLLRK
jgi:hypothetical protein